MKIFIILPAYNEHRSIADIIHKIKETGYENIIVIDDGSWDDTYTIAKGNGVIALKHEINLGAGAATRTGLDAAKLLGADIAITMDSDGQHDPKDIPAMIKPIIDGKADVVYGSRFKKANEIPFIKRLFNKIGNYFTYILSGMMMSDTQTGFRAFNKTALEKIDITMSRYEFCTEIVCEVAHNKLRMYEVPISVYYDIPEKLDTLGSGYNLSHGINTVIKMILKNLS